MQVDVSNTKRMTTPVSFKLQAGILTVLRWWQKEHIWIHQL